MNTFVNQAYQVESLIQTDADSFTIDLAVNAARKTYKQLSSEDKAVVSDIAKALAELMAAYNNNTKLEGVVSAAIKRSGVEPEGEAAIFFDEDQPLKEKPIIRPEVGDDEIMRALSKFGFASFREGQEEVVRAALKGQDSMLVLPTGGGKSLCYQLPALILDGPVIVVSPLIALMQDQAKRMEEHGAVMLASSQSEGENKEALRAISSGEANIVFVAPERFNSGALMEILQSKDIGLFVIDEAHCLSEWGHNFRPDYLRLIKVLDMLGRPPVMALTATATPEVAREIVGRLRLRDPHLAQMGFDRPNITFDVVHLEGKGSVAMKEEILARGIVDMQPAVVYCGTRKDTEAVAQMLKSKGLRAGHYHAGMDTAARAKVQASFMENDLDIIVATNAFGLGVDKADIRSVWHWALPSSIEAYYQEAGRAGRDRQPAHAVLLSMRADLGRLIGFNRQRQLDLPKVEKMLQTLRRISNRAHYFEMQSPQEDDDRVALGILERVGAVDLMPGGGQMIVGKVLSPVLSQTQRSRAYDAIKTGTDMGWKAYRAVERFSAKRDTCRRQLILAHFSDHADGPPSVRCCDVCEAPAWLERVNREIELDGGADALAAQKKKTKPAPKQGSLFQVNKGPKISTKLDDIAKDVDTDILTQLVSWRKNMANGRPAYTVCNNAALAEIARQKPNNVTELGAIKGVGPAFIKSYSESLLTLIKEFKDN